MNARTPPPANAGASAGAGAGPPAPARRFDARFIEEHQLLERYLGNKLPFKGARDLENWCRAHPEYLDGLKLSERAQASLKLLEASGRSIDLTDPPAPWWKSPYLLIGLAALAFASLLAVLALAGKLTLLRSELEDTRLRMHRGSLLPPAVSRSEYIAPDRAPNLDRARLAVSSAAPQLIDLHVDMSYTNKVMQFRLTVDKQDQGRVLIVNDMLKDSNGDLQFTFNTTGVSVGRYRVRIEALPMSGPPLPVGWLILDVT